MDDKAKLLELVGAVQDEGVDYTDVLHVIRVSNEMLVDYLITNGVVVQKHGRWIHPKNYVVTNGFLCSECGLEETSYQPINPRGGGMCIADKNGNFYYPPKIKFRPACGCIMDLEE